MVMIMRLSQLLRVHVLAKKSAVTSILFLSVISLFTACSTPCDKALTASAIVGDGEASLSAEIVKQDGPGRAGEAIGCIRVFVVNSENYADTLFDESVRVQDHAFHLQGFNTSTVDIIIDREGFFPVKYVGVNLNNGFNRLDQRVLMYPSDVPFTIPGELGVSLNEGATLDEIKSVVSGIDGVSFQRSPGGSYELKVPFQGTRVTRERVERVCRNLVYSRHIADARPLVNLSTIVPGL